MTRIDPIPFEELPQYSEAFELVEAFMGFVPTSMSTMAHVPPIFESFGQFAANVMNANHIEPGLVQLVAHIASTAAGCRYCQAHTAAHAAHIGVDAQKVSNAWEFETNDQFSESERCALRLANAAAVLPNAATDEHFEALAEHFSTEQIVQIVAVISLFGFLNRWNDTMATTLEATPSAFAFDHLVDQGWVPGKHAAD